MRLYQIAVALQEHGIKFKAYADKIEAESVALVDLHIEKIKTTFTTETTRLELDRFLGY